MCILVSVVYTFDLLFKSSSLISFGRLGITRYWCLRIGDGTIPRLLCSFRERVSYAVDCIYDLQDVFLLRPHNETLVYGNHDLCFVFSFLCVFLFLLSFMLFISPPHPLALEKDNSASASGDGRQNHSPPTSYNTLGGRHWKGRREIAAQFPSTYLLPISMEAFPPLPG